MDFVPLTSEQRRQFKEDGFFIVRGALDTKKVQELIEAGDRVIATDRTANRQRTSDGQYDGFRNCIELDDAFVSLLTHPTTVPLVVQLFGSNIHLVTSHLIYKHADAPGTASTLRVPGWHRDVAGVTEDLGFAETPRLEMKVAYYLTDLSKPNYGATLFSPGSNNLKEKLPIPEGRVDPENVIEPLLEPGDAVFFENRTWHAATANLSGFTRKCVMFGYAYKWVKEFDYVKQPTELVAKLDTIGRQLVGASVEENAQFMAHGKDWPLAHWCKDYGVKKVL